MINSYILAISVIMASNHFNGINKPHTDNFFSTREMLGAWYEPGEPKPLDLGKLDYISGQIQILAVPEDIPDKYDPLTFQRGMTVYIINATNESVLFSGQDMSLFMIQEAKNEDGEWQPIEYWQKSWCGNSYFPAINLPTNEYAQTSAYRYKGEFKTQLRFKLKNGSNVYYSNIFDGSINLGQFEKKEDIYRYYLE